jgi:hypothetical protein
MTTPHKMLIIIIFMLHFDHEYFPGEGILKIERIFFITNHFKQAIKVLCIETIFTDVCFIVMLNNLHGSLFYYENVYKWFACLPHVGSRSDQVKPKTIQLVFVASRLSIQL